jgi:hypothetical protein
VRESIWNSGRIKTSKIMKLEELKCQMLRGKLTVGRITGIPGIATDLAGRYFVTILRTTICA